MRVLVTGGQGFVGARLVERLLERGDSVRTLVRRPAPEWAARGVETLEGDLRDAAVVRAACRGRDVVFHVAAHVALWGPWEEFHSVNVVGTENVLAACRAEGVERLVYTSTPSVVFDNTDQRGPDESLPYPPRYLSPYPASKAIAERRVLSANGHGLWTVALRPHLIWGPGDPHIVGHLLARARGGRLFLVGNGRNRVDVTYIDNCVDAHLAAAEALGPAGPASGRAYFLSQGEPLEIERFMRRVAEAAGLRPRLLKVPYPVAWALGAALEKFIGRRWSGVPLITRFLAAELAKSHYYDISAARRDLGYAPRVSTEEGFRRLAASLAGVRSGRTTP